MKRIVSAGQCIAAGMVGNLEVLVDVGALVQVVGAGELLAGPRAGPACRYLVSGR